MSYTRQLPADEAALQVLADLYEGCGFLRYKMSKFEEYELYSENKSFLQSEHIITFSDGGKLMALKPDVTLSIAKNASPLQPVQRLYYTENVYRKRASDNEFSEIMQIGLESMGEIDLYRTCEVVMLACSSLELLGEYVLEISHMGVLSPVLEGCKEAARTRIMQCISSKALYDLPRVCEKYGVDGNICGILQNLCSAGGEPGEAVKKAREILSGYPAALEALDELDSVCGNVKGNIRVDYSALNDESYYNGIILRGYLSGVPRAVLSGGRYDKLMYRLGKTCGAIGFAVYIGELDRFINRRKKRDADVIVQYTEKTPVSDIISAVKKANAEGKSVRAVKDSSELEYGEIIKL